MDSAQDRMQLPCRMPARGTRKYKDSWKTTLLAESRPDTAKQPPQLEGPNLCASSQTASPLFGAPRISISRSRRCLLSLCQQRLLAEPRRLQELGKLGGRAQF